MRRALIPSLLLAAAACAPAPRPVAITPEFLDHAPRYQLVSPERAEADSVVGLTMAVQQELAQRGMLLAAPWETATYQVSVGASEGSQPYRTTGPMMAMNVDSHCAGPNFDAGHCTALDGPTLIPASAERQSVWVVSIRIREIASGKEVFGRAGVAPRSRSGVPAYQLRVLTKQILGGFAL